MAATSPAPDPNTAALLAYLVEHYLSAVARQLLQDGAPITMIGSEGPFLEEYAPNDVRLFDAEGHLGFGTVYASRFTVQHDMALRWDALSGWSAVRQVERGPEEIRWHVQGLVPVPARVSAFLAGVEVDFAGTGSDERPYFRDEQSPYTGMLERLAAYAPAESGPDRERSTGAELFGAERSRVCELRVVDALLAEEPDPVVQYPLRRSEVRALELCLEWLEPLTRGRPEVVTMLQQDLSRRLPGEPVQQAREALAAAGRRRGRLAANGW